MTKTERLNSENTTGRIYINNLFGKNINAYVGPLFDGNMRALFSQVEKNGKFFKVGRVNTETLEIEKFNDDDYRDSIKIVEAL